MTEKPAFSESDLNAYLDGELTGPERDAFESLVKANSDLRAKVKGYRDADETLRQALAPVASEGVPTRLIETLLAGPQGRGHSLRRAVAAAIVAFVIGGSGGWYVSGLSGGSASVSRNTVRLAQSAHQVFVSEVRHPVEVTASEYDHLVGWLSKRLGHTLAAPDFRGQAFELIGGRLLPGAETAAAQFMYEDRAGERITFYVARNPGAANTGMNLEPQFAQGSFDPVGGAVFTVGQFGIGMQVTSKRH